MNIPLALPPTVYFPNTGGSMGSLYYNRRINNGGMIYPFLVNGLAPYQGYGIFDTLKKEGWNIGKRILKKVGQEALELGKKYLDDSPEATTSTGSGISRKRKRKASTKKRKVSAKKLRDALLL